MAITESARHKLYQQLELVIGPEEATTLMEHLPPVGWANVATKDDLHRLDDRIDRVEVALTSRIDSVEASLSSRVDSVEVALSSRVDSVDAKLSGRIDVLDANLRGAIDRAMRLNTLVTVGVLGTLTTVVTTLT